jgi:hypothetical protein
LLKGEFKFLSDFSSGFKLKAPAVTPRFMDPKEIADTTAKKQMKILEVQEVFDVNDLNSTWKFLSGNQMWDVWKDGHGSKLIPLMPNNRGIKRAYILKLNTSNLHLVFSYFSLIFRVWYPHHTLFWYKCVVPCTV